MSGPDNTAKETKEPEEKTSTRRRRKHPSIPRVYRITNRFRKCPLCLQEETKKKSIYKANPVQFTNEKLAVFGGNPITGSKTARNFAPGLYLDNFAVEEELRSINLDGNPCNKQGRIVRRDRDGRESRIQSRTSCSVECFYCPERKARKEKEYDRKTDSTISSILKEYELEKGDEVQCEIKKHSSEKDDEERSACSTQNARGWVPHDRCHGRALVSRRARSTESCARRHNSPSINPEILKGPKPSAPKTKSPRIRSNNSVSNANFRIKARERAAESLAVYRSSFQREWYPGKEKQSCAMIQTVSQHKGFLDDVVKSSYLSPRPQNTKRTTARKVLRSVIEPEFVRPETDPSRELYLEKLRSII